MTLEQAIGAFKKKYKHWARPREAHGDCAEASALFVDFLRTHHVKGSERAREVHYTARSARHYPIKVKFLTAAENEGILREALRPIGGWTDHVVVGIGSLRVDWTARQFDKTAPFPLIWDTKKRGAHGKGMAGSEG